MTMKLGDQPARFRTVFEPLIDLRRKHCLSLTNRAKRLQHPLSRLTCQETPRHAKAQSLVEKYVTEAVAPEYHPGRRQSRRQIVGDIARAPAGNVDVNY